MIVKTEEAINVSNKLREQGKIVVLAGGCFDILHTGHLRFLTSAKTTGDILIVLLESDDNVKKLKGKGRPVNSQKDRAEILAGLKPVDYVVLLDQMQSDKDYDRLIAQIRPKVLAATMGDPGLKHKKRQAKLINAKVRQVIHRIGNRSTTGLSKNYK